jgi:Protein of unknown function (DUF2459)
MMFRSALLASLFAFLCMTPPPAAAQDSVPADHAVIYVVRRGWHIDIGFAAADIEPSLMPIASDFPGVRYLFFGFGDQRYLMAKSHHGPVLLAALWPGPGLLLTTAIESAPVEAFGNGHVIALAVTDGQLRAAQDFLRRSFADVAPRAPGPYEGSLYFTASARYSGIHTCNTWAAEALHAAGLSVRSTHVVFAGQLWRQVLRLQRQQSTPPPASAVKSPAQSAGDHTHTDASREDSSRSGTPPSYLSSAAPRP